MALGPAVPVLAAPPELVGRLQLDDGCTTPLVETMLVGRSPTDPPLSGRPCDGRAYSALTVDGPQVSRLHFQLEIDGWEVRVQDCDSTNGTFVSRPDVRGRRRVSVDPGLALGVGDIIQFGTRRATILSPRPADMADVHR